MSMKCSLLAATMLIGAINTTVVVGGQTDFSTYRLRDASLNTVVLCSDDPKRDIDGLSSLAEILLGSGEVVIVDARDEEARFDLTETVFAYVGDEVVGASDECMGRHKGFLEFVASHIQDATDGQSPPFYSSRSNERTTQTMKIISAICSPASPKCLSYAYVELLGFDTYICEVSDVCSNASEARYR